MIQIACSHGCDDGDQVGDGDHCHRFVPGCYRQADGRAVADG